MASFFNDTYPKSTIETAWRSRRKEMRAESLQRHNDVLFDLVSAHILRRRADIYEELRVATLIAFEGREIRVPLWTYWTTHYTGEVIPGKLDSIRLDRQAEGHDEAIRIHDDGRIVSIHDVVKHTDFLQRISAMFGPNYHVRDERGTYTTREFRGDGMDWEACPHRLILVHSPRERATSARNQRQATVAASYAGWYESSGVGEFDYFGGIFQRAVGNETPPPAPPRVEPPPLAQRKPDCGCAGDCPGWGCW